MAGKHDSSGISPIVGVMFMIALVAFFTLLMFWWGQDFLSSTSETISEQKQIQDKAAQSLIAIETVRFYDSGNSKGVEVDVRNVGLINVTVANLNVNGEKTCFKAVPAAAIPPGKNGNPNSRIQLEYRKHLHYKGYHGCWNLRPDERDMPTAGSSNLRVEG